MQLVSSARERLVAACAHANLMKNRTKLIQRDILQFSGLGCLDQTIARQPLIAIQ